MSEDACTTWTRAWSESMPDGIVADKIKEDGGFIDPSCIEEERVIRMVEDDLLDVDDLDDDLRAELFGEDESAEDISAEQSELEETAQG